MAKKGKKGKKGKKKGKKKEITDQITEVEREMFLIQIADLTAKVERLKARCLELESSNVDYEHQMKQLDEDRGDVITYLRSQTDQKQDEIEELEERVEGLVKARENDVTMYKEIIRQCEHDFKIMHEQLTSEIKLLTGKLNSLEDFRTQRDDLLKKFKNQEDQMAEQEAKHKEILYEVEKKFIIAKDKLKKEMEAKLLQLSSNFSDATEIRIAATTHHAIRENIAINNELDLIIATHNKLTTENEHLKQYDKELRQNFALVEEEKHILLKRNSVLLKLLNRLAKEHEDMELNLAELEHDAQISEICQEKLAKAEEELKNAKFETRIETQKLHGALYEQSVLRQLADEEKLRADKLTVVIQSCVKVIHDAMQGVATEDEVMTEEVRNTLLSRLLQMMDLSTIQYVHVPESAGPQKKSLYETGDLGLVPKSPSSKSGSSSSASLKKSSSGTGSKTSKVSNKSSSSRGSINSKEQIIKEIVDNLPINKSSMLIIDKERLTKELQIPGGRKSIRKSQLDDILKEDEKEKGTQAFEDIKENDDDENEND